MIASTVEYVFQNLDGIIVIIPEAWEMLPQSRMTPVKWVAEQFVRQGATINNYLWIDSQDIGGLDKTPLRQCDNWLLGRMKEAHEVERIIKQLLGLKAPAKDIQTLPLGHFYGVIGDTAKKIYVLAAGVPEEVAIRVAKGEITPEYVRDTYLKKAGIIVAPGELDKEDELDLKWKELYDELKKKYDEQEEKIKLLQLEVSLLKSNKQAVVVGSSVTSTNQTPPDTSDSKRVTFSQEEEVPQEIVVRHEVPSLTVEVVGRQLLINTESTLGRVALLYSTGFFDTEKTVSNTQVEMMSKGWSKDPRLSNFLDNMCKWGYLKRRFTDRWNYSTLLPPADAKATGKLITKEGM